jgi:hypothetical protein
MPTLQQNQIGKSILRGMGKRKREVARTKIGIVPSMAKATTRSE